ncbi:DUF4197 domain-containing protein [Nibrella saemangeumensis]|uniref:DUF4197 domain-containing protein n=1 Tax=Nibrella saemangeumensis TaxID=1084526 RepID=A0ABP8MJ81_9BACT
MKKIIWITTALTGLFLTTTQAQTPRTTLGKILEKVTQPTGTGSLTANEIALGLKEALQVGITNGAKQASAVDGYFRNPSIKLLFPPDVQRMEARLRQIGLGRQVDQFILSLNRAAEDAAKRSRPIFISAITSMTIQDALGILRGQPDAATQYLRRTTYQQLVNEFTPVVDSALTANNATRYYGDLVRTYNQIPLVQKANPDLTNYATTKAVDGLFLLIAQEEKKIRENPAARVSDILRRVFGSRQ